jgi:hypothetical protein
MALSPKRSLKVLHFNETSETAGTVMREVKPAPITQGIIRLILVPICLRLISDHQVNIVLG